jgi:hypothetical protein
VASLSVLVFTGPPEGSSFAFPSGLRAIVGREHRLQLRHILPHRPQQYQQLGDVASTRRGREPPWQAGEVDDDETEGRRSTLPWPDPVRSGPGRWTLLLSAAIVVCLAAGALAIVLVRM